MSRSGQVATRRFCPRPSALGRYCGPFYPPRTGSPVATAQKGTQIRQSGISGLDLAGLAGEIGLRVVSGFIPGSAVGRNSWLVASRGGRGQFRVALLPYRDPLGVEERLKAAQLAPADPEHFEHVGAGVLADRVVESHR